MPLLTSFLVYRDIWRQTDAILKREATALFNTQYGYTHSTQKNASFRYEITCDQGRIGHDNVILTEINSG